MGKKQVIDYVMNSPANTNKAVLEGMLDGMGGVDVPAPTAEDAGKVLGVNKSGSYALVEQSGGDCGYEGTSAPVSETITTQSTPYNYSEGNFQYDGEIDAPNGLRVNFNGTEYTLPYNGGEWGERVNYNPSFANYPLLISYSYSESKWLLITETAGTHNIVLEDVYLANIESITPCFKKAVESVIPEGNVRVFEITQTGQSAWTPSISLLDMDTVLIDESRALIGRYNKYIYSYIGAEDYGVGGVGYKFGSIQLSGSNLILDIFEFTSTGSSSHETMTLSTQ